MTLIQFDFRRLAPLALAATAAILIGGHSTALGQLVPGTQIQTTIRPAVWMQYSGGIVGTAVGIYDSGDPSDTFSRETSLALNIPPTTPVPAQAGFASTFFNQGTTAAQNIRSGGWLGATLQGNEQNTPAIPAGWPDAQVRAGDPAHLFTTATTLNRTNSVTSNGIQPWYLDYNSSFSESHTGQSFIAAANPANDLAVMVDPINATPLPFAYDNSNGGGRMLGGASNPLDSRSSSITYLPQGNARIPSLATIADPGFTYNVELIPMEFSSTLVPNAAGVNVVAGLGVQRQMVVTVTNAADVPNARNITATSAGLQPGYRPINAAGDTVFASSTVRNVQNANIAIGGTENANGFVLENGSVQVAVQDPMGANVPNFNGGNPLNVILPSQAARPFAVVSGTGMAATPFLWDTGAPNTSVPMAVYNALPGGAGARILPQLNLALVGGGNLMLNNVPVLGTAGTPLIGTNVINEFGQVWNYAPVGAGVDAANPNRGALTLTSPVANNYAMSLMGNGIVFVVASNTTGMVGTGVNQQASFGNIPQLQSGDAAAVGGDNVTGAAGTIYRTDLTGSNASYITTGASALAAGEVVTGLSLGKDLIGQRSQLFFTVSSSSNGQAGSAVQNQQLSLQAGASIYTVPLGQPKPNDFTPQSNSLLFNHELLGLGQTIGPNAVGVQGSDQLRDFKVNTQLALPMVSMSNLDPAITQVNQPASATRPRVGAEILGTNFDTYFATDQGGPTIYKDSKTTIFASGPNDIGLEATDKINSFALLRPTVGPGIIGAANVQRGTNRFSSHLIENANTEFHTFDPNIDGSFDGIDAFHGGNSDLALFTLAPDSPSLTAYEASLATAGFGRATDMLSPSDVFITDFDGTFSLYATAETLGLLPSDVIQGLDVVPEPTSLALLSVGTVILSIGWRKRWRKSRALVD
jgi:hypothetical protein